MMHGMGARRRTGAVLVAFAAALTTILAPTASTVAATGGAAAPDRATVAGDRGSWQVQSLGGDRYQVAWRSPGRFPLSSDRPTIVGPAGMLLGAPTIAADGRTVQAVVTSATRPDPADLDVLLSGDRLDDTGDNRARVTSRSTPTGKALDLPGTVTLADDPASPGPYAVATSDYQLDPVKLAGMPEPIEMVGHVVEPAADAPTGPRPLVLFLHGRHSVCYDPGDSGDEGSWPCQPPMKEIPSQLGYDYIQRVLASQGYATVSIRVNGINAQDYRLPDGGADARAQIVERHLDHWVGLAADHQVDLSRVVLVGHSRGGEGVDRASIQIPLTAPYRIVGQVLIAPTNFGTQTAPFVPTVTLLPFCDGDVSDLQGQRFTDVSRDLTTGDTSLKSSVLVMGANHNYFNTEWTPGLAQAPAWDDWYGAKRDECGTKNPDRLTPAEQQSVGTAYVAGAVHLFADDDQAVLPLFDGSRATVPSIGDAQVLSEAVGGGRDVRTPGGSAPLDLADGASTRMCQGVNDSTKRSSCTYGIDWAGVHPHWPEQYERLVPREFFEMSWTAAGQSGGMVLDDPLDLSTSRLALRTIVDPEAGDVDLRVRVTDADGDAAVLTPVGGGTLPGLGQGLGTEKLWAQTLMVDPSGATGVDLTRITQVDLVSASDGGRVWVADLGTAPAALADVPEQRLPTIDVGRVRIPEGDGPGTATAHLPFTVSGAVTRPARFSVVTVGQQVGDIQRFTIDLAPGQTSGSIPISYQPDRRDDFAKLITQVSTWAVRNMMTDAYVGDLTVLDDDPTPRITVRPVERTVAEGDRAEWQVTLSRPVDYDLFVTGRVVRGPAPNAAAGDVSRTWLRSHLGEDLDLTKPLWSYHPYVFDELKAGRTQVTLRIPTRKDAVAEGREALTLKLKLGRSRFERTVFVRG
ncbi:dienelactone hydrolase [Nocardioides sp. HB32]